MPNGIPGHGTFERVSIKLAPDACADRFGRWMRAACASTGLVPAAVENRQISGARYVPEGGHEVMTIPDLLAIRTCSISLAAIPAHDTRRLGRFRRLLLAGRGGRYLHYDFASRHFPTRQAATRRAVRPGSFPPSLRRATRAGATTAPGHFVKAW